MRRLTIAVVVLAAFAWAAPAFATATFSGTITTNTIWNSIFPGTIELTGNVTVAPGATLTIDEGVTVLVDTGVSISVPPGAGLVANGTPALPVTFTTATSPVHPGD